MLRYFAHMLGSDRKAHHNEDDDEKHPNKQYDPSTNVYSGYWSSGTMRRQRMVVRNTVEDDVLLLAGGVFSFPFL